MQENRPPDPYRPDPPVFPPIIFDDDEDRPNPGRRRPPGWRASREIPLFDTPVAEAPPRGRRSEIDWGLDDPDDVEDLDDGRHRRGRRGNGGSRGGGYASDRGLLRVLGLLGLLGAIVVALVVPGSPVRMIGGSSTSSGEDGTTWTARGAMPALPGGLVALSKLYDVRVPENAKGPWSIEVTLTQQTADQNNLGFYTYDGTRWLRLADVTLAPDGTSVSGDLSSPLRSIAVLRHTGQVKALGLIVQAGDRLDARAIESASVVAVMAAAVGTDGALQVTAGALQSVAPAAGKAKIYLGVSGGADGQAAVKNLASPGAMTAHAEAIAVAAKREGAGGVYLDFANVPSGQRDAFTAFVRTLRERLQKDQIGLVVGVPASGGGSGAYDWGALIGASDGLWLQGFGDPAAYYDQMEMILKARRAANTDLGKVSLIIDRRSMERRGQQLAAITLREALTAASTIDRKAESSAAAAGGTIALRAPNLGDSQQGAGLRWDLGSRMVAFTYTGADGAHSVWIENRFSAAFRMDLAARHGLGGVVADHARQDDALPDIWSAVLAFAQDGSVRLERPFGPYLAPCWQAAQGSVEGVTGCWKADSAPASVNWRAPQQTGTYHVRLIVSDGATFVAQEVALRVGNGTPAATASGTPGGTPTATATARPAGTPAAPPSPTATARPPTPAPTPVTPPPASTSRPTLTPVQPIPTPPAPAPTAAPTPSFPGGVPPGPAGQ